MQEDKARKKCNKILGKLEKSIDNIYEKDPELVRIEKHFKKYMSGVEKDVAGLFEEYKNAPPEEREERKKAYTDAVKKRTIWNRDYTAIITQLIDCIVGLNKKAVGEVNAVIPSVYAISYNQVAEQCREVGIKVKSLGDEIRKKEKQGKAEEIY